MVLETTLPIHRQQLMKANERCMRLALQLVTPKRRSARVPAAAAPPSAGQMLLAAGFAYAPNQALSGRLAAAADADGRLVLGDALDGDLLACMNEARPLPHIHQRLLRACSMHSHRPEGHFRTRAGR
jgi:hypothetical protein